MSLGPLHRGDTWTFDLAVTDLPPLGSTGHGPPLDLSGATVQLALSLDAESAPVLTRSYGIPASPEAVQGLARIVIEKGDTQPLTPGRYLLHLRVVKGAPPFVATQTLAPLKVLPSLLPEAV
jgi:hypothetical protein